MFILVMFVRALHLIKSVIKSLSLFPDSPWNISVPLLAYQLMLTLSLRYKFELTLAWRTPSAFVTENFSYTETYKNFSHTETNAKLASSVHSFMNIIRVTPD